MSAQSVVVEGGKMSKGWIGVDLDGTLAYYDGWVSMAHIGEPIPLMADRVKMWLLAGIEVRIVTARVSSSQRLIDQGVAQQAIAAWTLKHFNKEIPSTSEKDFQMLELWDDRCHRVKINTGIQLDAD